MASSTDMIILGESTGRHMACIRDQSAFGKMLDTLALTLRPLASHTLAGVSFFACDHTMEEISSPRAFTARDTFPEGRLYQRTAPSSAATVLIYSESSRNDGDTHMNQHKARRWVRETTLRPQRAPLSWTREQATFVYLSSLSAFVGSTIGIKQASADKGTSSSGMGASRNGVQ